MFSLKDTLGLPALYRLFSGSIDTRLWDFYFRNCVQPVPGNRILDLGCGPGDILRYLPEVDYWGIDISQPYIDAARQRFGKRGTFICQSATEPVAANVTDFDIVMANGLLHHLPDEDASRLLRIAAAALKPAGRFVSVDGCLVPGQSRLRRWLMKHDRGQFIRPEEGYFQLASRSFGRVEPQIHHDLLRIPWSHIIMVCSEPQSAVPVEK